jgi:Nickel responsive protein SCO4226-like
MAVYLVDRDLPGMTLDGLAALQRATQATCQAFTSAGTPVRYLHGLFVPGEARSLCLFEADDEATVVAVNDTAHLPFTRVVEALDLPAELAESGGGGGGGAVDAG